MELSKEAIRRLLAADIEVSIMGGCYQCATARAVFYHHTIELTVEVTHPLLVWQCGNRDSVHLVKHEKNGRSVTMTLVKTLQDKVTQMRLAATMSDEMARDLSERNRQQIDALERQLNVKR